MAPLPPQDMPSSYNRSGSRRPRSSPRGSPTSFQSGDDDKESVGSATFAVLPCDDAGYNHHQEKESAIMRHANSSVSHEYERFQQSYSRGERRRRSSRRRDDFPSSRGGMDHDDVLMDSVDYDYTEREDVYDSSSSSDINNEGRRGGRRLKSSPRSSFNSDINNEGRGGGRRLKPSPRSSFDSDHNPSANRRYRHERSGRRSPPTNFDDRYQVTEEYNISPRYSNSEDFSADWSQLDDESSINYFDDIDRERAAVAAAADAIRGNNGINQPDSTENKKMRPRRSWTENSRSASIRIKESQLQRPRTSSFHDRVQEIRRRGRANTDPFPEKKKTKAESVTNLDENIPNKHESTTDFFFPFDLHHPAVKQESGDSSEGSVSPSQMGYYDNIIAAATLSSEHPVDDDHNNSEHENHDDKDNDSLGSISLSQLMEECVPEEKKMGELGSHPLLDDDPIRMHIMGDMEEKEVMEKSQRRSNETIPNSHLPEDNDTNGWYNVLAQKISADKTQAEGQENLNVGKGFSSFSSIASWMSPTQPALEMEADYQSSYHHHYGDDVSLADDERSFGSGSVSSVSIMTGTVQSVNDDEKYNNEKESEEDEDLWFDTQSYVEDFGEEDNSTNDADLLSPPPPLPPPSSSLSLQLPPSVQPLSAKEEKDELHGISPLPSPIVDSSISKGNSSESHAAPQCAPIKEKDVTEETQSDSNNVIDDKTSSSNVATPPSVSESRRQLKSVSFASPFSLQRQMPGDNKPSPQPTLSSTENSASVKTRLFHPSIRRFANLSLRKIRKVRSFSKQRTASLRSSTDYDADNDADNGADNDVRGDASDLNKNTSSLNPLMLPPVHEESGDEIYVYEEDISDNDYAHSIYGIPPENAALPASSEGATKKEKGKMHRRVSSLQKMLSSIERKRDSELSESADQSTSMISSAQNLSLDHDRLGSHRKSSMNLMANQVSSGSMQSIQSFGDGGSFSTAYSKLFKHTDSGSDLESFSTPRSKSLFQSEILSKRKKIVRAELLEDDYDEYFDEIRGLLSDYGSDNSKSGNDSGRVQVGISDAASVDSSVFSRTFRELKENFRSRKPMVTGRRDIMDCSDAISRADLLKHRMKRREETAVAVLRSKHGFPTGLARVCYRVSLHYLPLRIWMVDNSGSMSMGDGRRFQDGNKKDNKNVRAGRKAGQVSQMVNCTRWEELRDSVLCHAELASELGAPTMFRLLNNPNLAIQAKHDDESIDDDTYRLPQVVGVCARRNDVLDQEKITVKDRKEGGVLRRFFGQAAHTKKVDDTDSDEDDEKHEWEGEWEMDFGALDDTDLEWVNRAQHDLDVVTSVMYEVEPRYTTPLTRHIWAIYDQVKSMKKYLRPNQKVAIVIATDGLPDEHASFLDAMRVMQKLPIYIVVRLCTNDDAAMHFWQTLDLDLNIPVEVLDDFESEAHQVFSMNPWITYSLPLQRIREWGYRSEILEKLRERPLSIEEMRDCCALIFGVPSSSLCDPKTNWLGFREDIEALVSHESRQWHPVLRKTKGWINLKLLGDMYGGKAERKRRNVQKKLGKEKKLLEKKKKKERQSERKKRQQSAKNSRNGFDSMALRNARLRLAESLKDSRAAVRNAHIERVSWGRSRSELF